jgi:hypothetical protein
MLDTGQYGSGLFRVPAETELPDDWKYFFN